MTASPAREKSLAPLAFFTGGTALRALSRHLAVHAVPAAHIVTTFDSGGSTAALRRAFAMPAVGDIRHRLGALADAAVVPPRVLDIWEWRSPSEGDADALREELRSLGEAWHPFWLDVPETFAAPLRRYFCDFLARMPAGFDPRGACFGNLVLTGAFLRHDRRLDPALAACARLLSARGSVLPIVEGSFHLAAELENGEILVGQHLFSALTRPVRRLFLTVHDPEHGVREATPCRPRVASRAAAAIGGAGLLCYPMGSFYSSVLANLLPEGVGKLAAAASCPKVFIPNSGLDKECSACAILDQVRLILRTLRVDIPDAPASRLLTHVLVDSRRGSYAGGVDATALQSLGIRVVDAPVVMPDEPQRHDPEAVAACLLRLLDEHRNTSVSHV